MLLRQTILYLPAQLVGPLVQFISVILWTHFLAPDEMGVFALITAAQEFAYIGTLFWFTLYTMRYYDKAADGAQRTDFLNSELSVLVVAAAGSVAAVFLLPLFVNAKWDAALLSATLIYSLSRTLATHLADRARTAGETINYSILQIVWPLLGLALGWLCVKLFGNSAASVLWGYAAGQIVALLLVLPRMAFGRQLRWSRAIIGTALHYGMPLVLGGLFVWLANNGIRFVIEHYSGTDAVGLVSVGWGLGLRVAAFAAMLVTAAAFPLAVSRARDEGLAQGQQQLVQNGVLLLAVLAPASAGLWAISTPLVHWLVAEQFQAMTTAVLPWAIVAGAARNLRMHFGEQVFLLRAETRISLINAVIDGVAAIAGGIIGLIFAGLPGSIMGAAAGAVVSLAITLAWGMLRHGYTFPLSDLGRIGAATGLMLLALHWLPDWPPAAQIAGSILAGAIVYGGAMALLYPGLVRQLVHGRREAHPGRSV